ncbi:ankyrin repeat domain-containing protein [Helicobacter sp. MIT 14-3879]|uniref:ankyrin repeat domain-containing protein n=1 Tax=Helicobacter sp. MIT 14-3879 TaxID=2040649 RepID=UPI000E1E3FA4|nr:ankyrin repeat domain-containing protein [Helicobacter sp. MIT 14-3879]RDU61263.1 ankyrin repeat domain-containing protein [Helicobacter sp. MIT 14-3879]
MKTREEIKALSFAERVEIENEVLELIKNNDLEGVKNFLKDYTCEISCYEVCFKDEKGEDPRRFEEEELGGDYPLLEPFYFILEAAYSCGEHNNNFSILDYLFNEYGLSLKDPKYNFSHRNIKYIKEINEKYILLEPEEEEYYVYDEALIYKYLEDADNPNPEIVKYLVNKGARFDVYQKRYYTETPLHFWARWNEYRLLEVAIKGGANVDMPILRGEYSDTLLFAAVSESENYRTTQLLIDLGANVNYAMPSTPLDVAKGTRNKKLLKEAGAMTSEQIERKFKLPKYDSSHCKVDGKNDYDLLGKYHDEYSKLLNDAIKGAKENPKNTQSSNKKNKK